MSYLTAVTLNRTQGTKKAYQSSSVLWIWDNVRLKGIFRSIIYRDRPKIIGLNWITEFPSHGGVPSRSQLHKGWGERNCWVDVIVCRFLLFPVMFCSLIFSFNNFCTSAFLFIRRRLQFPSFLCVFACSIVWNKVCEHSNRHFVVHCDPTVTQESCIGRNFTLW